MKVPVSEWYERYQRGSDLRCRDWEQWGDPRQTTYTTYTTMQRTREAFVSGLLDSISDDYDRGLSPQWVAVLDRVLAPLRYPGHGLQMVAAYIGSMAPSTRITIAATFQAADEMRRVQRIAYRMRQLQVTHPEFGRTAQQTWQDDPIWQPLREVIETLLVTWDWGEALVALQFVLKPAFDELFMTQFGRLARAAGDDVLDRMFLFSQRRLRVASRLEWVAPADRHSGHAGIDARGRALDRELGAARQPRHLRFPPDFR